MSEDGCQMSDVGERIPDQEMRTGQGLFFFKLIILALLIFLSSPLYAGEIAPTGTLRAVYLGSNPAQAILDRATGTVRGVAADLTRELGRRSATPVEIKPVTDPPAVIDAVSGEAG